MSDIYIYIPGQFNFGIDRQFMMDYFKLATTLDPRFKLDWCQNDKSHHVRDLLTSQLVQSSTVNGIEKMELTPCLIYSFIGILFVYVFIYIYIYIYYFMLI